VFLKEATPFFSIDLLILSPYFIPHPFVRKFFIKFFLKIKSVVGSLDHLEIKPLLSFGMKGPPGISYWHWEYSHCPSNLFAMYISGISTYYSGKSDENPQGTSRIGVTLQSIEVDESAGLFALPLPKGTKIGYVSLKKGTTIEQAQKQLSIGQDFSSTFEWGAKKPDVEGQQPNEFLHEVVLKGTSSDEATE